MRRIYLSIILLIVITLSMVFAYFKSSINAEDAEMQIVTKIDPVTGDKIEFHLKLYTLQNLHELIPSVGQHNNPDATYDKYIFCKVKNLSPKNAVYVKFKVISPNAYFGSWVKEITMPWLPTSLGGGNGQYALLWIDSPSLGIPDSEVKLNVEILELKRK